MVREHEKRTAKAHTRTALLTVTAPLLGSPHSERTSGRALDDVTAHAQWHGAMVRQAIGVGFTPHGWHERGTYHT